MELSVARFAHVDFAAHAPACHLISDDRFFGMASLLQSAAGFYAGPMFSLGGAVSAKAAPLGAGLRQSLREAYEARQSVYVIEHGGKQVACVKKGFQLASARCGFKVTPYMLPHCCGLDGSGWRLDG